MVMSKTAVLIDGLKAQVNLKAQVKGDVFTPNDAAYDRFRRGFNLSVDAHPALILVAEEAVHETRLQLMGRGVPLAGGVRMLSVSTSSSG